MTAALVGVAAIGGFVIIDNRNQQGEQPAANASPTSTTSKIMVPASLPDGMTLVSTTTSDSPLQTALFQQRVYGSATDPSDPTRMIGIEFTRDSIANSGCEQQVGAQPFTIGEVEASTCTNHGPLEATWSSQGINIKTIAGSAVNRDELIDFSRSLQLTPNGDDGTEAPPFNVTPAILTADWVALAADDATGDDIFEYQWSAEDQSGGRLQVKAWSNAPSSAIYTIQLPVIAERFTVRGHDGYVLASTGAGVTDIEIWWTEAPGLVVSASSHKAMTVEELAAFIETLTAVDENGFTKFTKTVTSACCNPDATSADTVPS